MNFIELRTDVPFVFVGPKKWGSSGSELVSYLFYTGLQRVTARQVGEGPDRYIDAVLRSPSGFRAAISVPEELWDNWFAYAIECFRQQRPPTEITHLVKWMTSPRNWGVVR